MKVKISVFFLLGVVLFSFNALAVEPIKLGAPTPLTGAYVSDGLGYRQAIEFAVDEINANGGLLGRPLKIILFDIGDFSPEKLMQAADELVGRQKVDSVHGGWCGWGQDVRAFGKYNVPFFMVDASKTAVEVINEDPKKYSNVFQLNDIEKNFAFSVFNVMQKLPYNYPNKKVVIIVAEDAWGMETGKGIEQKAKENGWEVALHEVVPYGTREWGPILTKIKAIKPAYIHVEILSPPDTITFFQQFMKAPTNSLINFGYGLLPPSFIKIMGEEANGIMGETTGMPLPVGPTPAANAWLNKFRKKYGNDPLAGGYTAYIGIKMWAEAVKNIGDVKNYKAINHYIATKPFYDPKSPGDGIYKFDKEHKLPLSSGAPEIHYQVQGGKLVTIYLDPGGKYLDYEFQLPPWLKK